MKTHPKDIPLYHLPKLTCLDSPLQIGRPNPAEFKNGSTEPDRHSFYTIFWITEGSGSHSIDFISYDIRPKTLFLLAPGRTHFFDVPHAFTGSTIFFEDDWLQLGANSTIRDFYERHKLSPALYLNEREAKKMDQYIFLLHEEFDNLKQESLEILSHLLQVLLLQIERFYTHRRPSNKPRKNQIASDFQRLVEEKFFEAHRLTSYADTLGITTDYLSEHIKEKLGVSPSKLIHQRITVEAKRLLAFTDLSSGEISNSLGFNDNAYFSRFFKRETGQTPLQFRKYSRDKYKNPPK